MPTDYVGAAPGPPGSPSFAAPNRTPSTPALAFFLHYRLPRSVFILLLTSALNAYSRRLSALDGAQVMRVVLTFNIHDCCPYRSLDSGVGVREPARRQCEVLIG